jgi:protein TonB
MPLPEGPARRRYARYRLAIPFDLTVFRPSAVTRLTGQAEDVGEGGLCGVISEAALPGERVELILALPASPDLLTMRAVVRHQSGLHCGFEFLSLEPVHREQLQRLASQPELQSRLINGTESEPGLAPPSRADLALCPNCGHELSEEIPVCLMCGEPLSPEVVERSSDPEAVSASAMPAPPKKQEGAKARRLPALDSLIAIIFLVTLSIGLWQWMHSPADANSNSQPSPVTVELENVFLRPMPAATEASASASSRTSALLSGAKSVMNAIIGGGSSQQPQTTVGAPGSAAATKSEQERTPASATAQYRSTPPRSAPALPTPPPTAPAASSTVDKLLAETGNAASAAGSSAASTTARSGPSASDLAGMLLQKVLPVYPEQARRQGVQGQVVLKAVIGKDGTVAELRPLQGPQELTAAAIDAVQHWRFRPYELKGKPVEVETDIRLNFQLPQRK